jgi:hypothetical protein
MQLFMSGILNAYSSSAIDRGLASASMTALPDSVITSTSSFELIPIANFYMLGLNCQKTIMRKLPYFLLLATLDSSAVSSQKVCLGTTNPTDRRMWLKEAENG